MDERCDKERNATGIKVPKRGEAVNWKPLRKLGEAVMSAERLSLEP